MAMILINIIIEWFTQNVVFMILGLIASVPLIRIFNLKIVNS